MTAYLRCLPMWQPYATAFCATNPDLKKVETRPGPCNIRGSVLIYATRDAGKAATSFRRSLELINELHTAHPSRLLTSADFGAIVGIVEISSSDPVEMMTVSDLERRWGNYGPGRWAWSRTDNATLFEIPVPFKGKQGWMHVPIETPGLRRELERAGRLDVLDGALVK